MEALDAINPNEVLDKAAASERAAFLLQIAGLSEGEAQKIVRQRDWTIAGPAISDLDLSDKISVAVATMQPLTPSVLVLLPPQLLPVDLEEMADGWFPDGTTVNDLMAVLKAYQVVFVSLGNVFEKQQNLINELYQRRVQQRVARAEQASVVPGGDNEGVPDADASAAPVPESGQELQELQERASASAQATAGGGRKGTRRARPSDSASVDAPPSNKRARTIAPVASAPPVQPSTSAPKITKKKSSIRSGGVAKRKRTSGVEAAAKRQAAFRAAAAAVDAAASGDKTAQLLASLPPLPPEDDDDLDSPEPILPTTAAAATGGPASDAVSSGSRTSRAPADLPRSSLAEQITRVPPRGNNRYRNSKDYRQALSTTAEEPGCFAKSSATTYDKSMGVIRPKYRPGPKPGSAAAAGSRSRIQMLNRFRRGERENITLAEAVAAGLRPETAQRLVTGALVLPPAPVRGVQPAQLVGANRGRTPEQRATEAMALARATAAFAARAQVNNVSTLAGTNTDPLVLASAIVREPLRMTHSEALANVLKTRQRLSSFPRRRQTGVSKRVRSVKQGAATILSLTSS